MKLKQICEFHGIPHYKEEYVPKYIKFNLFKKINEKKIDLLVDLNKNKIGFMKNEQEKN